MVLRSQNTIVLHKHKMKRKMTIFILVAIALPLYADEKDALLKEGAKFTHRFWTDVLGKPKLTFDKILPEKLNKVLGSWKGRYIGRGEKPELMFNLEKDGTWASKVVGPGMDEEEIEESEQAGNWYLYEGMILLYESPIEKDAEWVSALFMEKEKLRLIVVLMERGYVELSRQKEAEQADADRPSGGADP